ncbi:MAG: phospholipid carrier-dependent glycosyltransferase [Bacteroidetes bacterium]|nr:phospholipid carrier-dependent glycosyltransferase [Bacteroidota bacterium]
MTTKNANRLVWLLVLGVLACGWVLPPLMDFDAAQIGTISQAMWRRGDFWTLLNRDYTTGLDYDYLDKPHLVYWSAMLGYEIFGPGHMGMRFFSIVATLAAAFAVYRIGRQLYSQEAGRWAALIFVTAQAIFLSSHDVRTDALLTAFTVLSIWQLTLFASTRRWLPLMLGFLFLAFGVGTKGLIAALVAGAALFFFLLGRRDWPGLFNYRWPAGLLFFFLGLSPFLYAYYLQFDMHPEKFANGAYGNSGVKFLLWSHSMDRFAGNRNLVASPEFGFFYHTILWAFLPWSILLFTGVWSRLVEVWRTRGQSLCSREQLSFLGVWVMFNIMSMASFKLPHYLNILFPLLAVFTAGHLWQWQSAGQLLAMRRMLRVHLWQALLLWALLLVLALWSFPLRDAWIWLGLLAMGGLAWWLYRQRSGMALGDRMVLFTAVGALSVNFFLNAHVYPSLLHYQAGNRMVEEVRQRRIDPSAVVQFGRVVRSMDFYLQRAVPVMDSAGIARTVGMGRTLYVFSSAAKGDTLERMFPSARVVVRVPDLRVTRLKASFFDPAARAVGLPEAGLYRLGPVAR